uniref:Uncharacterized protein n=1 Tax=Arundo donax TaxID=35708 RepID=A0A0A9AWV5_ARUDO
MSLKGYIIRKEILTQPTTYSYKYVMHHQDTSI